MTNKAGDEAEEAVSAPRIMSSRDLKLFQNSKTWLQITNLVQSLADAAKGKELRPATSPHPLAVEAVIARVAETIAEFPTKEQSSRFGKPEFTDFYDAIAIKTSLWLQEAGIEDEAASRYFAEAWGNRKRIDYGSGHELNFLCFLSCLFQSGFLTAKDYEDVVLSTFCCYLKTMRKVQGEYWLEPAGSHGVWGLDDYHFLPFLFGAAQLVDHKYLRPMSIHDADLVDMYAQKNYYFMCIQFINNVKTASLRWHSPMLDDISAAKSWEKVSTGMVKMYKAEVLGKLPIMQHFIFSGWLPAPEGVTRDSNAELEHVHGWGDCCGIKVPSAIAASKKEGVLRVLPFD